METLSFQISFRGPFRVGGASPDAGLDAPLDRDNPLPGSSLKGLMKARAAELVNALSLQDPSVGDPIARIFGSSHQRGSWEWTDAEFPVDPIPSASPHLRVGERGVAVTGMVRFEEHYWSKTAAFTVIPRPALARPGDAPLIHAAACAVTTLGGSRRRGEGWVSIVRCDGTGTEIPWSAEDTERLIQLGGGWR